METKPLIFLKEVRAELIKVNWPKREDVVKMTALVIIVSIVVGFYIGFADLLLTKIMEMVLK